MYQLTQVDLYNDCKTVGLVFTVFLLTYLHVLCARMQRCMYLCDSLSSRFKSAMFVNSLLTCLINGHNLRMYICHYFTYLLTYLF